MGSSFKSCVFALHKGEGERAAEDTGSKKTSAGRSRSNNLTDPAPHQEQEKVKDAAKMFLNLKKQAGTTSKRRFAHFIVLDVFNYSIVNLLTFVDPNTSA